MAPRGSQWLLDPAKNMAIARLCHIQASLRYNEDALTNPMLCYVHGFAISEPPPDTTKALLHTLCYVQCSVCRGKLRRSTNTQLAMFQDLGPAAGDRSPVNIQTCIHADMHTYVYACYTSR